MVAVVSIEAPRQGLSDEQEVAIHVAVKIPVIAHALRKHQLRGEATLPEETVRRVVGVLSVLQRAGVDFSTDSPQTDQQQREIIAQAIEAPAVRHELASYQLGGPGTLGEQYAERAQGVVDELRAVGVSLGLKEEV